jgi:hypothetical protein
VTREEAIVAIVEKGKTREQAEAFLAIMGSAFRRRGWVEGEPLDDDALADQYQAFLGTPEASG